MLNMCLSSKLILHLSGASSLNIIVCNGTAPLEKQLSTPPASAGSLRREMDIACPCKAWHEVLSCPFPCLSYGIIFLVFCQLQISS